jgi:glycosyltransferase involved in cell wall biosynthesis
VIDSRLRICIVTPGYISQSPRVVREADALSAAGYDVRVVFTQGQFETIGQFDRDLLERKPWRSAIFEWSNTSAPQRWAYHRTRVRHHIAKALPARMWSIRGVIERAESRIFPELAALAAAEAADLYIGHLPDGLAAACQAARLHRGSVGYDVEDLYAEIPPQTPSGDIVRRRVLHLERRYLPKCSYVTAVSAGVAASFAAQHRCVSPVVVHNCHPWADRRMADGLTLDRSAAGLSLYWYSQTIGLNRGIQDVIRAAGLVGAPVHIHLRGGISHDAREALMRLADECGAAKSLHFHPSVHPDQLLSRAMEHDVGLALEPGHSLNNELTISNKILIYLTAGLALVASSTQGQREALQSVRDGGMLYRPGDAEAIANQLCKWSNDPAALANAKRAALEAARTKWNWETESRHLIAAVSDTLSEPTRARQHA